MAIMFLPSTAERSGAVLRDDCSIDARSCVGYGDTGISLGIPYVLAAKAAVHRSSLVGEGLCQCQSRLVSSGACLECINARAPQGFWGARGLLCVFGGVLLFHPFG
jgi:hypothetical protein